MFSRLSLSPFEDTYKNLIKQGLLNGNIKENVCEVMPKRNSTTCDVCGVTQMCSLKVGKVFFE